MIVVGLTSSALANSAPATAEPGESAPKLIGQVIADDCHNLALVVTLNAAQQRRAARILPKGFSLTKRPTLLIESSTCAGAKVNGVRIGRFSMSEAALSIVPPRPIASRQLPEMSAENIFMLSQLDTHRRLAAFKKKVGYRSEVTDVAIDLGNPLLVRTATAVAAGALAPTSVSILLTPQLLPDGLDVPNPGIIYKLWTRDARGRYVATTNSNLVIGSAAVGYGTVTAQEGTVLHRLLGGVTAQGYSFSGSATRFVNDTYRWAR